MTDQQKLLAEYVENKSEAAFRELVRCYVNLVYSTALRLVNQDWQAAEDVTQTVFSDLARVAGTLSNEVMLGGWLHRRTCHVAATYMRSERRRQNRERQACEMNALPEQNEDHEAAFSQIAPVLDEAINQLRAEDREAIVLRFFEGRDLRTVGEVMSTTEDAAQKRVARALEKLRGLLTRRGVTLSSTALAAALTFHAVSSAPVGLAGSVAGSAIAGLSASVGTTFTALSFLQSILIAKLKILVGVGLVFIIGIITFLENQSQARLRTENQNLQEQLTRLLAQEQEKQRLSNVVYQASQREFLAREQMHELIQLRAEVELLRAQKPLAGRLRSNTNARALATAERLMPNKANDPVSVTADLDNLEASPAQSVASICEKILKTTGSRLLKSALKPAKGLANRGLSRAVPDLAGVSAADQMMLKSSGLRIIDIEQVDPERIRITVEAKRANILFKLRFKGSGNEWKFEGTD